MGSLDWGVLGLYFFVIFGVAFWAGRQERKGAESEDFFLAGRNVGWFVIGASLFASNIGSEHLIGLAGTGAASGVPVAQFEILAGLILLLLGWLFVPFYVASGVYTMPEFLERRYSKGSRTYLAIISVAGYILTKISVTVMAGGIVFETLMGIDFWTGAIIVVLATAVYTVWGGLRAVLYTDMVQMFVLLGGALAVTWFGLEAVGGWGELKASAGEEMFSLWRPMTDPEFPWTGILFGAPILGVWYWCTDQYIVQRVLSAKSQDDARKGTIFAAYLKQLPIFIFVVPGIIAAVLASKGELTLDQSDQALPALMGALLPVGIKGLVVAGLLAALMSSLSSVFNSCSTVFTMDIYKQLKPETSDHNLKRIGQIATIVMVVLGMAWIPLMKLISSQLYTYIQSVQAYISPPIAAVFLLGVLWRRANAKGAFYSLIVGGLLGLVRLILEANKDGLSGFLYMVADANFLHVAIFLFVICSLVLVIVSLMSEEPDEAHVAGLTMAARGDAAAMRSSAQSRWASVGVIALVAALWIYFS
ncbi:MAG: sodium/solute symporter [Alphaproteobacteria bacterium]|nr:sodium/solute symporter [Alphaproteobacteria bacterium]